MYGNFQIQAYNSAYNMTVSPEAMGKRTNPRAEKKQAHEPEKKLFFPFSLKDGQLMVNQAWFAENYPKFIVALAGGTFAVGAGFKVVEFLSKLPH